VAGIIEIDADFGVALDSGDGINDDSFQGGGHGGPWLSRI
jgi:hypothetical protein